MKSILFDLVPFQDSIYNGGALYTKMILERLIREYDVKITGVCFDKNKLNLDFFDIHFPDKIEILEFDEKGLNEYIASNNVELFFIAISQRYNHVDLTGINCKIVMVCHDLFDFSLSNTGVNDIKERVDFDYYSNGRNLVFLRKFKKNLKDFFARVFKKKKRKNLVDKLGYSNFSNIIKKDNLQLITVSEYSKNSIVYYIGKPFNDIHILYPPEEIIHANPKEVDLSSIGGKKFFLLLSTNRFSKNLYLFYRIFDRWNKEHNNEFACVLVGIKDIDLPNSVCFKSVSNAELLFLLQNCYSLIYPSLCEGFGHPPIEAMKFGKPVVASFDTSIPEICKNAAVFFNPFYEEDLFYKLNTLVDNYDELIKKSKSRYSELSQKQKDDFTELLEMIGAKYNE